MMSLIETGEVLRRWTARRTKLAQFDLLLSQAQSVLIERDGQHVAGGPGRLSRGDVIWFTLAMKSR